MEDTNTYYDKVLYYSVLGDTIESKHKSEALRFIKKDIQQLEKELQELNNALERLQAIDTED
jgi:prefoldin subunit 5